MIRASLHVCLAILAFWAVECSQANGATIDVDTILGPDHPYFDQTIRVIDSVDPPTKLTILPGTLVGESLGGQLIHIAVDAYGQSIVELMNGGINGATTGVLLHDDSVFHMFDGSILGGIEARDSSRVIVENGFWGGLIASGTSRVRINNSPLGNSFNALLSGQSHTVISGGDMTVLADEQSTVVLKGGFIRAALASEDSTWLILDGNFVEDGLEVDNGGIVHVRGLSGDDFGLRGLRVNLGTAHIYGTGLHFESQGGFDRIVGTLADGDPIDTRYVLNPFGKIILHEVPEPGTWGLLAVGAGVLVAGRRSWGLLVGATGDLRSGG